jgi:hypothetical protein
MAWKITADVVPEKAGRPVSISYSTAPEEIACCNISANLAGDYFQSNSLFEAAEHHDIGIVGPGAGDGESLSIP